MENYFSLSNFFLKKNLAATLSLQSAIYSRITEKAMTCIVPSSTTCRKGTHRTMVPFLPSFPPRYMLRNTIKNYSCFFFPREKNIFILDFNPLKRGSLRVEPFVVCRNSFFPCFSSFFLGQQFCFSGLLSCPFHCNLSLPCPVYSRSLESTVGKCHL